MNRYSLRTLLLLGPLFGFIVGIPAACSTLLNHPLGEGECRTEADCSDGTSCYDEDDPFYGDCEGAERACEGDGECGEGNVCAEYQNDHPCNPGELSTRCVAACLDNAACLDGEQCDTATGHCVIWACADGYTCPTYFSCTPDTEGTGCARDTCTDDAGCGEGWCVDGACFAEPGFCSYAPP